MYIHKPVHETSSNLTHDVPYIHTYARTYTELYKSDHKTTAVTRYNLPHAITYIHTYTHTYTELYKRDHNTTAVTRYNLSHAIRRRLRPWAAAEEYEVTKKVQLMHCEGTHLEVVNTLMNIALNDAYKGDLEEGERKMREVVEIHEQNKRGSHPKDALAKVGRHPQINAWVPSIYYSRATTHATKHMPSCTCRHKALDLSNMPPRTCTR